MRRSNRTGRRKGAPEASQTPSRPVTPRQVYETLRQSPWLWRAVMMLGATSLWWRLWALDHMPGVNADELVLSVMVRDSLDGAATTSPFITSSHRFIPLYTSILYALEFFVRLPVWGVRAVGLFFGLCLVVSGCYSAARLFNRPWVACGVALLIACLPVHIAYSRLGWDAAQISFASLFVVYFVLQGRAKAAAVAGLAAFLVHPTNVFLAPIGLMLLLLDTIPDSRLSLTRKRLAYLCVACSAVVAAYVLQANYLDARMLARLHDALSPNSFVYFWRSFADLLSGASSYTYFVVEPTGRARLVLDALGCLLVVGLLGAAFIMARDKHSPRRLRYFPLALLLCLLAFYLVQPRPENGRERYFLGFTVPLIFCLGLMSDRLRWSQVSVGAAYGTVSAALLGSFYVCYFHAAQQTRTYTHPSYATGAVDPKVAAVEWIVRDAKARKPGGEVPVVTDGWWTYWTTRYLAAQHPQIITFRIPSDDAPMPADKLLHTRQAFNDLTRVGAYALGFAQGSFAALASGQTQRICDTHDFNSFTNQPVIRVWRYCEVAAQASRK